MINSAQGFLQQTADYLYRAYGDRLHRFCIVFPNIRAGLFFKKYLAGLSGKPVWSPAFHSLHSLMEQISDLTLADRFSMIFDLYQAYQQHKPTSESFDDFYFWGEMLLDDFDEVDKNMVDAKDLFRNISDLKEIEKLFDYMTEEQKNAIRLFWQNFNDGNAGIFKTEFSTIWPSLFQIYDTFRTRLKAKKLGYEGMIAREAMSMLRSGDSKVRFEKYVFIGFNALTPCEKYFFRYLQKSDHALFFWDYDDYYVTNLWHEAGSFMRDNIRSFPQEYNAGSRNLTEQEKQIEIISVPSDTGQARMAGQILGLYPNDTEWDRTAVVLADEHLLLPVLSIIPPAIKDINITMGYPFTYSPVNSLFEHLSGLQKNARVYSDGIRFYHQDICSVLYHPYIQDIASEKANETIQHIIEHNKIYVPVSEIPDGRIFQLIFTRCDNAQAFIRYLMSVVSEIVYCRKSMKEDGETETAEESPHEQYQLEYLYTFYTSLQRIKDILDSNHVNMDMPVFSRLLRKVFSSLKIPFSGEPLKGLQIMGMLETRALDFERVVILSMNEGIFPRVNPRQSFIPYHLRKGFGLTTPEQHDAVNAYYFYRLIQRARDIRLIYNSAVTDRNTGEQSRYLSQLFYEPVFKIRNRNITFHLQVDRNREIIKERNEEVQKILKCYYGMGEVRRTLSPSALNSYLDCRLRFYFRYVEGLEEADKVADEVDKSIFGKLLHKTMQLLYEPYENLEINTNVLTRIQKNHAAINEAMLQAFAEDYFYVPKVTDRDINGRNIIIKEVLSKYVHRILEVDKTAPFMVHTLEKRLDVQIPVTSPSEGVMLNVGGYIDRLDNVGDTLRIIDYKTGNAKRMFTSVPDLFDREKSDNHAVMQTLVYAYMVRQAYPQFTRISPVLYIVKDLFENKYDPRIRISRRLPIENYFDISDIFEAELNELLSEIFLSDTPFTQTTDEKKCLTCLYADICHRKHR